MPLFTPPGSFPGPVGFFGATPAAQPGPHTSSYALSDRAVPAYTGQALAAAFTNTPIALLNAPTLDDLNVLRAAYENLRAFAEATAKNHRGLVVDLQTLGLIS